MPPATAQPPANATAQPPANAAAQPLANATAQPPANAQPAVAVRPLAGSRGARVDSHASGGHLSGNVTVACGRHSPT